MTITEPALPPVAAVPRQREQRPESARTLGAVRIPHAPWIVLGGCVLAFAGLLYLSRNQDFFADEWAFVTEHSGWTLRGYFLPHNEHWSTLPKISYTILFAVFGMQSYLPFSAILLLVHTAAAFVLFLIVRRQAGDLIGIAAAGLLLLVGQGAENVFWAFQVGFVGSVLLGLIAIWLLQAPGAGRVRPSLASAALVASLASSGIGLFFLPTVAVDLWLDRARRRLLWVLAAPVAAYGVWFLAFGRAKVTQHRSPLDADPLRELVTYVPSGIGSGLAGMLSLGSHFGMLAFAGGTTVLTLLLRRTRPLPALAIGATVGLVLQYTVTGLVRAQFGDGQAMSSRYVYVATVFGLLIFATALAKAPFTGVWRPVVVVVLAGILLHDTMLMAQGAAERAAAIADPLEDRLQTAWLLRDAPGFDPAAGIDPARAPTLAAGDYIRVREELGSAYPDLTVADLSALDASAVNDVVRAVLPLDQTVVSAAPPDGTCQNLDPEAPFVRIPATDGTRLWFVSTSTFPVQMHVNHWLLGDAVDGPAVVHSIEPGEILMITVADSGQGLDRQLQVSSAPGTLGTVCHAPAS